MRRSARGRDFLRVPRPGAGIDALRLQPLPDRDLRLRIVDVARHAVDELLQRVRALHAQIAAAVAVGVDVDGGLLLQLVGVRLGPFGGAQQPRLFAVPHAVDDGALRLPALLQQRRRSARASSISGAGAGDRILRAVHPGVVMIAADDPLVGIGGRRECARSRCRAA